MTCYLYKLVDPNQQPKYVGITDDPETRKRRHCAHKPPHEFVIISQHNDRFEAGIEEVRLISQLETHVIYGGWNQTWGGEYANVHGMSRKGIGGRKKGSPGNRKLRHSEETKRRWSQKRRGRVASTRFEEDVVRKMLELYRSKPEIKGVGKRSNGRIRSYERAFSREYAHKFGMTRANIYKIITGNTIAWKHLL